MRVVLNKHKLRHVLATFWTSSDVSVFSNFISYVFLSNVSFLYIQCVLSFYRPVHCCVWKFLCSVSEKATPTYNFSTFVNNNFITLPIVKKLRTKSAAHYWNYIIFCSNNFSFSSTTKLFFFAWLFRCHRSSTAGTLQLWVANVYWRILQAIIHYHTFFLSQYFLSIFYLPMTTFCKFYVFLFAVNKLWHHIHVIVKLSVIYALLNFRFWLPG